MPQHLSLANFAAKYHSPNGGLTPAGRKYYAQKTGSKLRPGVMRHGKKMTVSDLRRKGSWARRFYGRKVLPPLVDKKGRPTRLALTAKAWGEPVPRTEAQARVIANKGTRLLQRYKKARQR